MMTEIAHDIRVRDAQFDGKPGSGEAPLVGPLTFEVAPGEFLSIVGPGRSGKSVLVKMLAGILTPTSGEISFGGSTKAAAGASVGIVFDDPALLPWRTVLQNVLLQAELRGSNPRLYVERARQLLARVDLTDLESEKPFRLTTGMAQRVSLCRALLHDPTVLLLDEPFRSLDSLECEELASDLQQLWMQRSRTVVLATCHIAEAVRLSDSVAVLSQAPGRLVHRIAIDLPRPRRLDKATTPLIAEYCDVIRTIFRAQGILS
jgi:NitT/TauT family transport system ATP-binding protein